MKNAKHSTGPWRSNPYQHPMIHGYAVYSDKACLDKIADDIKSESNARLIAAAPELYSQVVILLDELYRLSGCVLNPKQELISKNALDVLRKARGES